LITFDDGYRSVLDVALPILARFGLPSVFFVSAAFLEPASLPLDNLLCWLAARVGAGPLQAAIRRRPASSGSIAEIVEGVADLPYARRTALGYELAERYEIDRARIRAESRLFLDWHELARLNEFGCELANHTRSHLFCRCIIDQAIAEVELVEHRRQLEEWSHSTVRAFSYPYGRRIDATPLVESVLTNSGHEASFLVESRTNPGLQASRLWNRVSLDGCPSRSVTANLELLPRLRAFHDHWSTAA